MFSGWGLAPSLVPPPPARPKSATCLGGGGGPKMPWSPGEARRPFFHPQCHFEHLGALGVPFQDPRTRTPFQTPPKPTFPVLWCRWEKCHFQSSWAMSSRAPLSASFTGQPGEKWCFWKPFCPVLEGKQAQKWPFWRPFLASFRGQTGQKWPFADLFGQFSRANRP